MSSVDPRRLAPALATYEQTLRRWLDVTASTTDDAHFTYRHGVEAERQSAHRLAISATLADHDAQEIATLSDEQRRLVDLVLTTRQRTHGAVSELAAAASAAQAARLRWTSAVAGARDALAARRAELSSALQELAWARDQLRQAEADLSEARSDLSACQSDPKRLSCSSESNNVFMAQEEVQAAQWRVSAAEDEVHRCQLAVSDAEARLGRYEHALELAQMAEACALDAAPLADESVTQCERAQDSARQARKTLDEAEVLADAQQHELIGAVTQQRQAEGHLSDATRALRRADRHLDSAASYGYQAQRDLQDRQDALWTLNRPDLGI